MSEAETKSLFKRFMLDKDNTLNKKEFIIVYIGYWIFFILFFLIIGILFSNINLMPVSIGLSIGFVMIMMQRLKFFGMNKFIGAAAIIPIFNIILFIWLVIKSDDGAVVKR